MRLIFTLFPQFKRKKEKRNKKQMRRGSALSDRTNVELSLKMKRRKEKEGCCTTLVAACWAITQHSDDYTNPLLPSSIRPSVRPRGTRKSGAKRRKGVKWHANCNTEATTAVNRKDLNNPIFYVDIKWRHRIDWISTKTKRQICANGRRQWTSVQSTNGKWNQWRMN